MMRTLEGKWSEMLTFGVAENGSLLRKRPGTFAVWPIASERRRGRAKVNHYQQVFGQPVRHKGVMFT